MRFESPVRGLRYHADSSRYIILTFLLNHYAWVHVQYTPAWGGNTHTPRTQPAEREQVQPSRKVATQYYLFHVHIRYNLTSVSVDQKIRVLVSEHTETAPLLETGL